MSLVLIPIARSGRRFAKFVVRRRFPVMNSLLLPICLQFLLSAFATSDDCLFAVFEPRTDSVLLHANKSFVVRLNKPSAEEYTVLLDVEYPDVLLLERSSVRIPANSTEPNHVHYHAAHLKSNVYIAENRTSKSNVCETTQSLEENFVLISVYRLDVLNLVSTILGWVYFAAWTISFWPQILLNIRRKSVVGLNFDFLALNATGFLFYSVYNCALFYVMLVQFQYLDAVPNSVIPVQLQDVAFAVHALLATLLTCVQCFIYERGSQRISRICIVLLAVLWSVAIVGLIVAAVGSISWFIYVTLISYAKLVISIVKYIPQVILNYRRKSTEGFSIGAIFLDFTGGICSMCQMFIIAYNMDEWSQLFGDFTKFGLGLQSIIFDVIFFVQRYGLYGRYNPMKESVTSSTLSY
uniref:Cystinosin homolog n=1 Tax=Trichuris muris TaxID=70415 RepID=A0A5S6QZF7_TRIMR